MESIKDILKRPGWKDNIPAPRIDDIDEKPESPLEKLKLPEARTFGSFVKRPGTEAAIKAFRDMAEGRGKPFLLCYGTYGNGKTHLLQAMIWRLYERGIICVYSTFEMLLQRIKSGMRPDSISGADFITQKICEQKWLAIDDFGLGSETKWAESRLDIIIDYRYRYRLPTVLVTNRDLTEIPPRVESRFADPDRSVVVVNEGKDYRRRKL